MEENFINCAIYDGSMDAWKYMTSFNCTIHLLCYIYIGIVFRITVWYLSTCDYIFFTILQFFIDKICSAYQRAALHFTRDIQFRSLIVAICIK